MCVCGTCRFPVTLRPAPLPDEGKGEVQPLVQVVTIMQMQGPRGQPYYPYLSFRITRPVLVPPANSICSHPQLEDS